MFIGWYTAPSSPAPHQPGKKQSCRQQYNIMISYKCTTCTSYASRHSFRAQRPMTPSSSTTPLPGKNQELGKALLFRRPGPAWRSGACFAFLRAVESKGGSCGGKPPPLCRAVLNPGRRRQSSLLCAGLSSRRSSAAPAQPRRSAP